MLIADINHHEDVIHGWDAFAFSAIQKVLSIVFSSFGFPALLLRFPWATPSADPTSPRESSRFWCFYTPGTVMRQWAVVCCNIFRPSRQVPGRGTMMTSGSVISEPLPKLLRSVCRGGFAWRSDRLAESRADVQQPCP